MKCVKQHSGGRQKAARKRPTVTFNHVFLGQQLRPNARIPISAHQEVGSLLKSVWVAGTGRARIQNIIDEIRGELDEWAMREYPPQEVDYETFNSLYYVTYDWLYLSSIDRDEMISRLEAAKAILAHYYPDCSPLAVLIALVDKAIASIRAWKGKAKTKVVAPAGHLRQFTPKQPV